MTTLPDAPYGWPFSRHPPPATVTLNERDFARQIAHILAPLTPNQAPRREIMAHVLVHTTYSLLSLSVQDGHDHAATITELKRMLASYLLRAESTSAAPGP